MADLIWAANKCPRCGSTVAIGCMSLAATCACGMYFADVSGELGGWYEDLEAYRCGEKWEVPRA